MSNLEGDLSWLPVSGKAVHHSEEGGREQPLLLLLTSQGICRVLGRKQATQSQRVTSVSQATIPRPLRAGGPGGNQMFKHMGLQGTVHDETMVKTQPEQKVLAFLRE